MKAQLNFSPHIFAYVEDYTIRANEVDRYGQSSLTTFINIYQEAAINHAKKLGLDLLDIAKDNLTWVLSRIYLEVERFPLWREVVYIHTWPVDSAEKFAIRDFEFFDSNGKKIAAGASSTMLMDLTTRRAVGIDPYIGNISLSKVRAVDHQFSQLSLETSRNNLHNKVSLTVRRSDMDINGHVNATQYVNWALEGVDDEFYKKNVLSQFEIAYRREAFRGDHVGTVVYSFDTDSLIHEITRKKDNKELAKCVSTWKKRSSASIQRP